MFIYKSIEYSDTFLKTSVSSWQFYRNKLDLNDNDNIIDFHSNLSSILQDKYERKNGTKDFEIMAPLKCLCNFCRKIKMPLINCEISILLGWSKSFF